MSHAQRSIMIYGLYLGVSGIGMCVAPNAMLASLGVEATTEGYIRMLGLVLFILALYYVAAARAEVVPFYRWSVWGRGLAVLGVTTLALAGLAPTAFVGIAAIDAAGAIWTATALRKLSPVITPAASAPAEAPRATP